MFHIFKLQNKHKVPSYLPICLPDRVTWLDNIIIIRGSASNLMGHPPFTHKDLSMFFPPFKDPPPELSFS